jgi:hypothetical protein
MHCFPSDNFFNVLLIAKKNLSFIKVKNENNTTTWLRYSSFAAQLFVMLGIAVWGGAKLDQKLNLHPLFTIVLPLLVLGVTFYKLIKDTLKNKS